MYIVLMVDQRKEASKEVRDSELGPLGVSGRCFISDMALPVVCAIQKSTPTIVTTYFCVRGSQNRKDIPQSSLRFEMRHEEI